MNEAILNLLRINVASRDGKEFAIKTLSFMRNKLMAFQDETGDIFNLEATPAEGTSYRWPASTKAIQRHSIRQPKQVTTKNAEPFYTNRSQLPVDFDGDLFEALEHQDSFKHSTPEAQYFTFS